MLSLIDDHLIFFIVLSTERSGFCVKVLMNRVILVLIESFVVDDWTSLDDLVVSQTTS